MSTEIEKKIEQYCLGKDKMKELKSEVDKLSSEIKQYLSDNNLNTENGGRFIVTVSARTTEDMDTEALLKVLKSDWAERNGSMQCPYIKTKEYVDMDVLESYIYKGELPKETVLKIDKCRIKNTTYPMTYKERKD